MPAKQHPTSPITRIREALRNLSPMSGMADLVGTTAFSEWLGCSPSLIRNIENGHAKLTRKFATRVQELTGVSAEWMLSNPDASETIMDVDGNPWDAEVRLDPYKKGLIGLLFSLPPSQRDPWAPQIIGKLVERQVLFEAKNRSDKFARKIIQLLAQEGFFTRADDIIDATSLSSQIGTALLKSLSGVPIQISVSEGELVEAVEVKP